MGNLMGYLVFIFSMGMLQIWQDISLSQNMSPELMEESSYYTFLNDYMVPYKYILPYLGIGSLIAGIFVMLSLLVLNMKKGK